MGLCALCANLWGKAKGDGTYLYVQPSSVVHICSQPCGGAPDITTPDPIIAYRLVGIMQRIKEC